MNDLINRAGQEKEARVWELESQLRTLHQETEIQSRTLHQETENQLRIIQQERDAERQGRVAIEQQMNDLINRAGQEKEARVWELESQLRTLHQETENQSRTLHQETENQLRIIQQEREN